MPPAGALIDAGGGSVFTPHAPVMPPTVSARLACLPRVFNDIRRLALAGKSVCSKHTPRMSSDFSDLRKAVCSEHTVIARIPPICMLRAYVRSPVPKSQWRLIAAVIAPVSKPEMKLFGEKIMTKDELAATKTGAKSPVKQIEPRATRSIRFSDDEWTGNRKDGGNTRNNRCRIDSSRCSGPFCGQTRSGFHAIPTQNHCLDRVHLSWCLPAFDPQA